MATTANGPIYTLLPSTAGSVCVRIQDLDLNANEAYRFEVTFRYTGTPTATFEPFLFDDISLTVVGGPLPVDFQGFIQNLWLMDQQGFFGTFRMKTI